MHVVSVVIDTGEARLARSWHQAADATFITLVDKENKLGKLYGFRSVPRALLINSNGILLKAPFRVDIDSKPTQEMLQHWLTEPDYEFTLLQQAVEALDAVNRAKSAFMANMSHELRTPLNAILGCTQILQRDNHLFDSQRERIDIIHRSGEHLLALINDILDLSKIEAGKVEVELMEFSLPEFLRHIGETARLWAEQKGLSFESELLSPLPIGVRGDEKRLRQVLLNLLGNAVKFTAEGQVTLKVGYPSAYAGNVLKGKHLRFQVEDTGIGIAADKLRESFLPFHQVHDLRNRVEGTGLGLTVSQRLVRLMGGELQVQSTLGIGSTFWFELELPAVSDSMDERSSLDLTTIGEAVTLGTEATTGDEAEKRLIPPPQQELGFLLQYAQQGRILAIRDHIDRLEKQDERFRPFTAILRQFASAFETEKMCGFLKPYLSQTSQDT